MWYKNKNEKKTRIKKSGEFLMIVKSNRCDEAETGDKL